MTFTKGDRVVITKGAWKGEHGIIAREPGDPVNVFTNDGPPCSSYAVNIVGRRLGDGDPFVAAPFSDEMLRAEEPS